VLMFHKGLIFLRTVASFETGLNPDARAFKS
jgi:hypothetical protein